MTKIKFIKRIMKITIACSVVVVLIVLGFFVKNGYNTFENSGMEKWLSLTESQRIATLRRVVPNCDDNELLLKCVTRVAQLPDSDKMDIRDAIVICYNGIKLNENGDEK